MSIPFSLQNSFKYLLVNFLSPLVLKQASLSLINLAYNNRNLKTSKNLFFDLDNRI